MSEVNFDEPMWHVEIEHRNPDASPIWGRVVNASDKKRANEKALALFEADGLSVVLIRVIRTSELIKLEEVTEDGPGDS